MSKTWHLRITPHSIKAKIDLLELFNQWGIHDIVEAAYDNLDIDQSEAEQQIAAMIEQPDLPISIYREESESLRELMAKISNHNIHLELTCFPTSVWSGAWDPSQISFETDMFSIQPHDQQPLNEEKKVIYIQPGAAFGDGQHATTRALLALIEKIADPTTHRNFLDVGTGTGILAIGAEKIGISHVVATDIDPEAIRMAETNRRLNQCNCQIMDQSLPCKDEKWHIIASNILPPAISNLLPQFVSILEENGLILCAGFNEANKSVITEQASRLHLQLRDQVEINGWLAYAYQSTK